MYPEPDYVRATSEAALVRANGMLSDMLTKVVALQLTASTAVYAAARGVLIGCQEEIGGLPSKEKL